MEGTLHAETVERVVSEAETWAELDAHDHIVGVVDWGSEPLPWIAMEYMDAGHLGAWLGDEPSLAERLWVGHAVVTGVRHAHRHGVAHLDLKPENVLFRSTGETWPVPKIADWGLSKHLLTHSTSVEGLTPAYAAPEQFADEHGPTDNVTDVYQVGAVLYELFTGEPPFDGPPAQVMHQVLHEEPTPPSERVELPAAVDDLVLTAMATDRAERYDSVLYLRDDIQSVLESI
jgi:serine/threonine protein kinase